MKVPPRTELTRCVRSRSGLSAGNPGRWTRITDCGAPVYDLTRIRKTPVWGVASPDNRILLSGYPVGLWHEAYDLRTNKLLWKYPVRVALNPFFSTVGWSLASLISGSSLVAMVLSLQTTGPMMIRALTSQDMYLAGSFLLLLSGLTIIGTLLSDILLAWVDPRIRLSG